MLFLKFRPSIIYERPRLFQFNLELWDNVTDLKGIFIRWGDEMDKWMWICVEVGEGRMEKKRGGVWLCYKDITVWTVLLCVPKTGKKKKRVLMSKYWLQAEFFCQPSGPGQARVGISGQLQYSKVNILFTEVMKLDRTGIVNKMGRDLAHRPTDATLTTVWPQRKIWYFGLKHIQLFSVCMCYNPRF